MANSDTAHSGEKGALGLVLIVDDEENARSAAAAIVKADMM